MSSLELPTTGWFNKRSGKAAVILRQTPNRIVWRCGKLQLEASRKVFLEELKHTHWNEELGELPSATALVGEIIEPLDDEG